jgi:hypothetical protein
LNELAFTDLTDDDPAPAVRLNLFKTPTATVMLAIWVAKTTSPPLGPTRSKWLRHQAILTMTKTHDRLPDIEDAATLDSWTGTRVSYP